MTAQPITYAVVGGPPANWIGLRIIDLETGEEVDKVVEVDTRAGWVVRLASVNGEVLVDYRRNRIFREAIFGSFEIRPPAAEA